VSEKIWSERISQFTLYDNQTKVFPSPFSAYKNDSGRNRRTDLYLKENEHLHSSERLIDDQINIAIETKEHMMTQRGALKRIQSRVNDLSSRFPLINSLVQRINFRRRRDAVILGSVIGVCILLLILYSHN